MNYKESKEILDKIQSSENILLNLHHNPDADSVGSAIAMARVLKRIGKPAKIISPTEISSNLEFLRKDEDIEVVEFSNFNFSKYDLFIANDSSSWSRVSGDSDLEKPNMFFINIDHHKTNQKFGTINLVEQDASANSLVLFKLFQDWSIDLDERISEPLLAGILGDTGCLRFPEAGLETFEAALELMKHADKQKIIFNLYQSYEENHIHVWTEIMKNIKIDHEHKFVYSFVKREVMEKYGFPRNAKAELADMNFQSVAGTDFGLVGEESDGYISVSLRARNDVDVSVLASKLGGGGHKWAAAARVWEGNFDKTVEKILDEARKFSK